MTLTAKTYLQVWQLSEGLAAHVALVFDFAILLLQRVRQCLVACWACTTFHLGQVNCLVIVTTLAGVAQQGWGRLSGHLLTGRCCACSRGAAGGSVGWTMRVRVPGISAVRTCCVSQRSSSWEGTCGPWKEEVSVARNGGGVHRVRY